jgi:hypothetical protein
MYKLATIGALIAALALPAAAAGHRARPQQNFVRTLCKKQPVFPPGKDYTFCGPRVFRGSITVWVRDPETGQVVPMPFGRWQHQRDGI